MRKKKKEEGRGEESRPGGGSRCCCWWWRWLTPVIRWCARSGWQVQTAVLPFLCSVFFFMCFFFSPFLSPASLFLLPFSLMVAQGRGEEKDQWWFAEGTASSRLLLWFFFSPLLLLPWFSFSLFCSVSLLPLWFCWRWQR